MPPAKASDSGDTTAKIPDVNEVPTKKPDSNMLTAKRPDPNYPAAKTAGPDSAVPKTPDLNAAVVKTPDPPNPKPKFDWYQNLPTIVYSGIAIAILILFGVLLRQDNGILAALRDKETARGLITFLIAVTTMGIAIILAISTLLANDETEDKRFDRGKQVLTVLIGLLGTIVGFYYGSEPKAPEVQKQALAITAPTFEPSQPTKGDSLTVNFSISGGTAPYDYSITVGSATAVKGTSQHSGDPIQAKVMVPDTPDPKVPYLIKVTDKDKNTFEFNKDGSQTIPLKPK